MDETTRIAEHCHPACFACRSEQAGGLGLRFVADGRGGVVAEFPCRPNYQGYPDRLHGGIISMLLDAAMTHCLFANHVRGYTVRLALRFHRPVNIGESATIYASLTQSRPPLYYLTGEVWQSTARCASAKATFIGEGYDGPGRDQAGPAASD